MQPTIADTPSIIVDTKKPFVLITATPTGLGIESNSSNAFGMMQDAVREMELNAIAQRVVDMLQQQAQNAAVAQKILRPN